MPRLVIALVLVLLAVGVLAQPCDPSVITADAGTIRFFDDDHNAGELTVTAAGDFTSVQTFNRQQCGLTLSGTFTFTNNNTGAFEEKIDSCNEEPACTDPPTLCDLFPVGGNNIITGVFNSSDAECKSGNIYFLTGGTGAGSVQWKASASVVIASFALLLACLVVLL